jgi:cytochrome oxidase Cu insertion factor (SCO1/SenC/PrrC family)
MLWLGPLLALVGVASYFTVFVNWPITRDVPWVNLILLALALAASIAGLMRARRRVIAAGALALTLALSGFFVWYCYVFSYDIPSAELALDVGAPVPAVVLRDDRGQEVELAKLSRDKLVLVFFRGHW